MKRYDQIHETVLKDIFDVYNDIKGLADGELGDLINKQKKTRYISSIARKSNDLICVFPVLSSRNISIDTQAMVSKAIEKNCVAMLQMLFSAFQLSDADNAIDYIKAFHTNINKSAKLFDLDDIIKVSDSLIEGAIQAGAKVDYKIIEQVKQDMKNLNYYFEDTISSTSLAEGFVCNLDPNGKYQVHIESRQLLTEEDIEDSDGFDVDQYVDWNTGASPEVIQLHTAVEKLGGINNDLRKEINQKDQYIDTLSKNSEKAYGSAKKQLNRALDAEKDLEAMKAYMHSQDRELDLMKKTASISKDFSGSLKDQADFFSKQVLNSEYKKANELQPTLMVVNFKSLVGDRYVIVDSIVIGVKAKLYPMASEDMVTHLVAKCKDANWIQKLIKASTREISFFKDFLFAIEKAKVDALSLSKKGSSNKMWKVLERRGIKSRWNKLMARSNDATAITTIMISQNEIDFMKKEFLIDISDVRNSRILMEKYNLLGLCIVDESLETAKFMYDTGEDMWETLSFTNLEKESNDNTYKKVVNLMTKVM